VDTLLYGIAYYPEYMPYDRLDQDGQLMQRADISVVRVGESSWGLREPQDGKFEFALDGPRRRSPPRGRHKNHSRHPRLFPSRLDVQGASRNRQMKLVATNVTVVIVQNSGYWILEEQPKQTTDAFVNFL
jgi:glycosyl hydrolase family 42 (putative beta-galactosidase)